MSTSKKRASSPEPTREKTPEKTDKKAVSQPFPWLSAVIPASASACFSGRNLEVRRREISERASLLRRLGYDRSEVLARLAGYQTWEYEPFHKSPLAAEVATLVDAVFAPAKGRVTTLQP